MSASLVGSEMCIRDRGWPARLLPTASVRLSMADVEMAARVASPAPSSPTCLLYTSDAADDM
eukprot:9087319-Alexandrium_andersonii.AAC.1